MFDIPVEPHQFAIIQDHEDYMMAVEQSSIQNKTLILEGKEYPVKQAWIYVQYPYPYYEQEHRQTGKKELVFSQWYLSYFSCVEKKSAIPVMKFYGKNREPIRELEFNIQSINDFEETPVDSVGELQLNEVCSKAS